MAVLFQPKKKVDNVSECPRLWTRVMEDQLKSMEELLWSERSSLKRLTVTTELCSARGK